MPPYQLLDYLPPLKARHMTGALALLCACALGDAWSAQATPAAVYQEAIAQARRGEFELALGALAQLIRQYPKERIYLYDFVSILERAGRHQEALDQLPRIERATAPAYVLEALARAAASTHRYALAEDLSLQALKRFPGRAESLDTLVAAYADEYAFSGGVPARAPGYMAVLTEPDQLRVMQALAARLEAKSLYYAALFQYQEVLKRVPDLQAEAAVVRIAARLGASHLAVQLADRYPRAVTPEQIDDLVRNRSAMDSRWGTLLRALPRQDRHGKALLDDAISRSDDIARRFLVTQGTFSENELKWLHDRMVLLDLRERMREAVMIYERFEQRRLPLAGYVYQPVADAYMWLRQPRDARRLYELALRHNPDDFAASMGKYYALAESGEDAKAYDWIDKLARDKGAQVREKQAASTLTADDKARHWSARVLAARAREYGGELAHAQQGLNVLLEEAPHNAEVRSGLASVYRARGWPRLAREERLLQQRYDPDDAAAYSEAVAPLLDTYRFEKAEVALQRARRLQPDSLSVIRAARAWQLHNRPEFSLQANSGKSSDAGSPSGSTDHNVDAYLYSAPFGERYRVFAHGHYAWADLVGSTAHQRRAGAGIEYRGPDLRLTGEWHAGISKDGTPGLNLGARWWLNDHLNLGLALDTKTTDLPLKARQANIDARRYQVDGEYRWHESRSVSLSLGAQEFSDDNRRRSAQLGWRETWWTRPRWNLATRTDLYTSTNSRVGAPYFNPGSDRAGSVSLIGDWRSFQWYERSFLQQLTLSGGRYWQEDFGTDSTWGIEYAHVWDLDGSFYLRYGLGRSLHPYDGQTSGRNYILLDLNWKF